jgi:hypothetical protein
MPYVYGGIGGFVAGFVFCRFFLSTLEADLAKLKADVSSLLQSAAKKV